MSFEVDTSRHAPSLDIPELKLRNIDDGFFPHSADLQPPFAASAQEVEVDAPNDRLAPPELTVPELVSTEAVQVFPEPVQLQKPSRQETAAPTETALVFVPGTELGDRHTKQESRISAIKDRLADNEESNEQRYKLNERHYEEILSVMKHENGEVLFRSKLARERITTRLEQLEPTLEAVKKELLQAGDKRASSRERLAHIESEIERLETDYSRYYHEAESRNTDLQDIDVEKAGHHQKIAHLNDPTTLFTEQDYKTYIHTHDAPGWTGEAPSFPVELSAADQARLKYYATSFIEQSLLPNLERLKQQIAEQQVTASMSANNVREKLEQVRSAHAETMTEYQGNTHVYESINARLRELEAEIDELFKMAEDLPYPSEETMIEKYAELVRQEREAEKQRKLRAQTQIVTIKDPDFALGYGGDTFEVVPAQKQEQPRRAIESHDTNQTDTSGSHKSFWARLVGRRVVEETAR